MNLVELQRALRQLRLSGMAAGLEPRLLQAQTDTLAPIGSSTGASSRPPSATWARRSTPSISTSTRR